MAVAQAGRSSASYTTSWDTTVVTFTDKAARELTTRVSSRLSELEIKFNLNEMYLGTFHSICLRILEDFREFTRLKRRNSAHSPCLSAIRKNYVESEMHSVLNGGQAAANDF